MAEANLIWDTQAPISWLSSSYLNISFDIFSDIFEVVLLCMLDPNVISFNYG